MTWHDEIRLIASRISASVSSSSCSWASSSSMIELAGHAVRPDGGAVGRRGLSSAIKLRVDLDRLELARIAREGERVHVVAARVAVIRVELLPDHCWHHSTTVDCDDFRPF